jgi:ubiquinone/menaquinone biosynthesis C-methylase UbiE
MKSEIKKFIKKIPILNNIGRKIIIWFENRENQKIIKSRKNANLRDYDYLSVLLTNKDKEMVASNPGLKKLHKQLNVYRQAQISSWNSFVYCKGYYYQGYLRIGINGIKPTEPRMENYSINNLFNPNGKALDIGSNSGFMVNYLSDYYNEIVGIEINPYLIKMGETVSKYLNHKNISFVNSDFITHNFDKKFDAVFSLSNHFTIDGNLNMSFESYINKIYNVMNDGGILFFESHNIDGDDKDLEEKFRVADKYFQILKYKMVKSFYPADIDKLFAVFIKKNLVTDLSQDFSFNLEYAKTQYSYVEC